MQRASADLAAVSASLAETLYGVDRFEEAGPWRASPEDGGQGGRDGAGSPESCAGRRCSLAETSAGPGGGARWREAVALTEGPSSPTGVPDTLLDLSVLRPPEEADAAAGDTLHLYEAKGNVVSTNAERWRLSTR